jgi:hypothetical protein
MGKMGGIVDDMMEIVRLITMVGLKQSDSFFTGTDSSMLTAFFNGLESGEFLNDEIAAHTLYHTTPKDVRYRQLKSRLREKLYDLSIFINFAPPKFSVLRQKMYECNREQIAMKQCIENGAQEAGYMIAKRLLIKARKYHLTIIEIESLYAILNHIIAFTGNEKEYTDISEELRYALQKLNAETEVEIIFGAVSVKYAAINSDHPENAPFIEECIHKIESILNNYDTFKIRYSYFILRSLFGQVQRDFAIRLQACNDAIEYCNVNRDIAGNLIAVFTSEKAECYFHLRKYDAFLAVYAECEPLLDNNTSIWLILKSYEVQTLLSIGQPIRALESFKIVQESLERSSGGITKYKEQWLILEGYIYFFFYTEPSDTSHELFQRSLLEKYLRKLVLNGVSSLAGDKEGANIGLMILHIVLLLGLKSNPNDIEEKINALDRYKRRNLRKGVNSRTDIFITMLRQIVFENFDMKKANAITKNLFRKLSSTDETYIDSVEDYEVIPYDIVWKKIMEYYGVL